MDKNKTHMTDELLPIKRSRKKPKVGDVFVIQPRDSIYFYGKVIKTNIETKDPFIKGMITIFIYKKSRREFKLPKHLNPKELLIPPCIVNLRGWTMGYFFTLGNIGLTEEDRVLNYGFRDSRGRFLTEEHTELKEKPDIVGTYGLGSYGAVAYEVTRALEEHPELLDV
ncbi:MAG: immunity 26/phosphotriesterase HocA family protein [Methanosarcinaceae archaeon]|nr:immunity 26/phosphotriesterase HocA family protein [Methanosarcinaceae archaeon]